MWLVRQHVKRQIHGISTGIYRHPINSEQFDPKIKAQQMAQTNYFPLTKQYVRYSILIRYHYANTLGICKLMKMIVMIRSSITAFKSSGGYEELLIRKL